MAIRYNLKDCYVDQYAHILVLKVEVFHEDGTFCEIKHTYRPIRYVKDHWENISVSHMPEYMRENPPEIVVKCINEIVDGIKNIQKELDQYKEFTAQMFLDIYQKVPKLNQEEIQSMLDAMLDDL